MPEVKERSILMSAPGASAKLLVTDAEAARMLSMGRSTFWRAVRDHALPAPVKIGGLTRWRVADLQSAIRGGSQESWKINGMTA